jgi:hypothetical protein
VRWKKQNRDQQQCFRIQGGTLETTSNPSTEWIRVPLFLLLLIVQPVGTSHWGPVASPQQQQEPNDRETFHVPQNQLSSSHKWDHLTDNMMASKSMDVSFVFGTKCNFVHSLEGIKKELHQCNGKRK